MWPELPRKAPRMNAPPDLSMPRTLSKTVGFGLGLASGSGGGAAGAGGGGGSGGGGGGSNRGGGGRAGSEGEEEDAMARRQADSRSKKPSGASGRLLLLASKKASSGQRSRLFLSFTAPYSRLPFPFLWLSLSLFLSIFLKLFVSTLYSLYFVPEQLRRSMENRSSFLQEGGKGMWSEEYYVPSKLCPDLDSG